MTDELSVLLEEFPGSDNRTRCFNHVLNLVAKSVLKQFDLPKGRALDAAGETLAQLSNELEVEMEGKLSGGDSSDDDEDDNNEGLTDIRDEMPGEEVTRLDASLQPVRLVLVKVSVA